MTKKLITSSINTTEVKMFDIFIGLEEILNNWKYLNKNKPDAIYEIELNVNLLDNFKNKVEAI